MKKIANESFPLFYLKESDLEEKYRTAEGYTYMNVNGYEVRWPSWEFLSTPSARRATAKTETKSLFSYKLYNILHEFRRALIYNGSKNDPNHAK